MRVWVSKKRMENLEKKIAALENEQLSIRKFVNKVIKSDEELIEIVKKISNDIKESESVNANRTELFS